MSQSLNNKYHTYTHTHAHTHKHTYTGTPNNVRSDIKYEDVHANKLQCQTQCICQTMHLQIL